MTEDPDWPRASGLLESGGGAGDAKAALFGVPFTNSISPSRAELAPAVVREALARFSTFDAFGGRAFDAFRVADLGDVSPTDVPANEAHLALAEAIRSLVDGQSGPFLVLGGDNAITRPALNGILGGESLEGVGLVTFDAHHDVRTFHAGPTNGTPVRGLIEDGLDGRAVHQIGLGAFSNSEDYRRWADEQGIGCITAREVRQVGMAEVVGRAIEAVGEFADRIYLDVDLDVLDRAFAPGCPGARPGGITPDELIEGVSTAASFPGVVAVDFVEFDPEADSSGLTALNAGSAVLAAVSGFASRTET